MGYEDNGIRRKQTGWSEINWGAVAILFSILMAVFQYVYFQGTVQQSLIDLRERLGTLETEWHTYLRETRGITIPQR